jgi:sterol O-acyltransferase
MLRTGVKNYEEEGVIWGSTFATMISEDAIILAISDAVLVSATVLCVPFIKVCLSTTFSTYSTHDVWE